MNTANTNSQNSQIKSTSRRLFLKQCSIAAAAGIFPLIIYLFAKYKQNRPNIIYIMADDLGNYDLSSAGSDYYKTPNIDALKEQGIFFSQAYASGPVCLPTRAAFITGKTPARMNMTAVFDRDGGEKKLLPPVWTNKLPHTEETISERLKKQGYHTGFIGKWHLGPPEEFWPEHHGFDENIGGYKAGKPSTYFSPWSNPRLKDGPKGEYLTNRLASEAVDFIERNKQQPFFLYFAPYSPHTPLEAPASEVERFKKLSQGKRHKNPVYAAMIARLDDAVGKIMQALKKAGLMENTILVFTSDNGGVGKITDNSPLRGAKFQLYEGGIRVPAIAYWPGVIKAGTQCRTPVTTHDWTATFLALAGAEYRDLDGSNLLKLLKGNEFADQRSLGWHFPHYMPRENVTPSSVLRYGNYKLHYWYENGRIELYDLEKDEGETKNLAGQKPELASQLKQRLFRWLEMNRAKMPRPNPDYQRK
ncbi:MAG: sulfatase [Cyanobacteriota bacterium]|nr:sulfatase [Cyanobacteriota bacterium]